jgi:hypothetical protein
MPDLRTASGKESDLQTGALFGRDAKSAVNQFALAFRPLLAGEETEHPATSHRRPTR